ncbi:unnamed protein product, partial [marine sediment metagenome]
EKIYRKGGPIKVSTTSPRRIVGYSLISAGAVSTALSGYYLSESIKYYKNYEHATNDYDLARYRDKTQQSDMMWQLWGGIGLAALGTGIYFLATDYQRIARSQPNTESRFVLAPEIRPNGAGISCLFRF